MRPLCLQVAHGALLGRAGRDRLGQGAGRRALHRWQECLLPPHSWAARHAPAAHACLAMGLWQPFTMRRGLIAVLLRPLCCAVLCQVVLATAAAIIASQALITGSFSIVQQVGKYRICVAILCTLVEYTLVLQVGQNILIRQHQPCDTYNLRQQHPLAREPPTLARLPLPPPPRPPEA